MKQFFRKRFPSLLLTLIMVMTMIPAVSARSADITYTVRPGSDTSFDVSDFESFYTKNCSGTFKYVEFQVGTSSYNNFSGYVTYEGDALSRTGLTSNDFYYDDSYYGDYPIKRLALEADKNAATDSIEIGFTVYGGSGNNTNQYAEGTLALEVSKSGSSSSSKGDISYTVKANDSVSLSGRDFEKFYDNDCSGTFKYVVFDRPSSSDYADGYIYYRYGKSKETYFSRNELNSYKFYYSDSDYGDYDLDELSFVSDKSFSGPIKLTFTVYGGNGSKYNQSASGTLIISTTGSSSSSKGDITYTVKANDSVSLSSRDFKKFYDNNCSGSFKYVVFDRPSSSDYADGYIYYRYGKSKENYFSRSDLNDYKFYYSDSDYGDYDLDELSFVSDRSFTGPVKLSFTVYGGSGSKTNQSASGTLVISTGSSSTVSRYSGNIRYSTTPGTALQINPNDLARFYSKNVPGAALRYVVLTGIPSTGSLYYNYYGTSQYGISSRMQLTSSSASGKVFSFSPSSTSEYALSELTYIPSGSNYCTAVSFAAYGSDGSTVTGSILISVTASAVAEVYTVATKGTSVSFPASSVYSAVSAATGSGLASIQLLELPTATSGVLYCGSTRADLTTNYSYTSSSDSMTQLRFVPNGAYTGSVSIPYVALGSSGTAIAAGTVSIGIVNSVKKFTDISTSTWCYKYITELSDANIISGYSNGSFQEKNTITYGAALKLIMLAAGYSEQAPTTKGSTFSGYLTRAKADGLVEGNPKLNGSITRLQIAQIAAKAMKLSVTNLSNKKPFTDTNDVYVQALNAAGIIEGYFANGSSTYKPNNTLTRGQVSAIVWRMRNYNK